MFYDLYCAGGWLQRRDPRAKLAALLAVAALFVVARGALPVAALLLALHLLLLSSAVPPARLRWLWAQLRLPLLLILLIYPWMAAAGGPPLARLGPLHLTAADMGLALATALRLWGMSLLFLGLLFVTTQPELVRGLVALGLPYRWGLTLALALRYIPTLARQVDAISEAQAARGWDPARGALLQRLRGVAPLLVALLIFTLRSADTLTMALTARGVGRGTPRTYRQPLRMAGADWALLALALACLLGALGWLLLHGA